MAASRIFLAAAAAVAAVATLSGCEAHPDLPVTFIDGPRVLAIKAEPPEVAPGATASVTALVVGPDGAAPPAGTVVSWSRCLRAPLAGQTIHPDCFGPAGAPPSPYLEPVGEGATVAATMPDVAPDALGLPDATGGVYLPLIARVETAGGGPLLAAYRLRRGTAGVRPNTNPTITSVLIAGPSGWEPLDDATPRVVHPGDRLELSVSLGPASAEAYLAPFGGPPGVLVTEQLATSWFADAGDLSRKRTTNANPSTVLSLDQRLPALPDPGAGAGVPIHIYVVTRDERGGTDTTRRTLLLAPR